VAGEEDFPFGYASAAIDNVARKKSENYRTTDGANFAAPNS